MPTDFIVTDITNMTHGNVCLAGVIENNENVRPIRPGRIPSDWCHRNGHDIKPFSLITLEFQNPRNEPPHTEDRWIDSDYCIFQRDFTEAEKLQLLNDMDDGPIDNIFNAPILHAYGQKAVYIESGNGDRSLGTIKPKEIINFRHCQSQFNGRWDYRLEFSDQVGDDYRIKIKDFTFQSFIDHKRICQGQTCEQIENYARANIFRNFDGFLRIGLARGWGQFPERCYLQITGIYTFPDYANGLSFQDLQREIAENGEPEIPF